MPDGATPLRDEGVDVVSTGELDERCFSIPTQDEGSVGSLRTAAGDIGRVDLFVVSEGHDDSGVGHCGLDLAQTDLLTGALGPEDRTLFRERALCRFALRVGLGHHLAITIRRNSAGPLDGQGDNPLRGSPESRAQGLQFGAVRRCDGSMARGHLVQHECT